MNHLPNNRYVVTTHGPWPGIGKVADQEKAVANMKEAKRQKDFWESMGYDRSKITIKQLTKKNAGNWWFGN